MSILSTFCMAAISLKRFFVLPVMPSSSFNAQQTVHSSKRKAESEFKITHVLHRTMLSSIPDAALLLKRYAHSCVVNPKQTVGDSCANAFFRSVPRYVYAWHELLTAICNVGLHRYLGTPTRFHPFLQRELETTKSRTITILNLLISRMEVLPLNNEQK